MRLFWCEGAGWIVGQPVCPSPAKFDPSEAEGLREKLDEGDFGTSGRDYLKWNCQDRCRELVCRDTSVNNIRADYGFPAAAGPFS
jgi:hypothetical protein